jgi:hypothetical protein
MAEVIESSHVRNALTLYEAEGYLAELLETEGAVTPEMQAAFDLELTRSLAAAQAKRESVAQFILHCEAQAEFAQAEAKRIKTRGEVFERTAQKVRDYVLSYIMAQGIDAQGRYPKLTGKTTVMSARSNPASVEVMNEEAVPARFKTARVEMPLEAWHVLVDKFPSETAGALKAVTIDRRMVKDAIRQGENVEGTDLNLGRFSLQIR